MNFDEFMKAVGMQGSTVLRAATLSNQKILPTVVSESSILHYRNGKPIPPMYDYVYYWYPSFLIGANFLLRKAAGAAGGTITISIDGDLWTLKSENPVKTTTTEFKLGQEFDETTADGRKVKSTVTMEADGRLLHRSIAVKPGEKSTDIYRSIDGDGNLVYEMICEETKCVRTYKKTA